MKGYPSLRNNVFHLSMLLSQRLFPEMLPRNVVRAEADWPDLHERRLDRKGRDFFPPEPCLALRFVFSFFSCGAPRPHRKSISQNGRHFNYGTPGNCKVHGNVTLAILVNSSTSTSSSRSFSLCLLSYRENTYREHTI